MDPDEKKRIGRIWRRARLTLGLSEADLCGTLRCTPNDIALAELGDIGTLRQLTGPFNSAYGVDLYVLAWCLGDLPPDVQPAAALAESLAARLRQLGAANRLPGDWTEVRRQTAAMTPKAS